MTLKEASVHFKIPLAVLFHFKKKGLLHNPLTNQEISFLYFYQHIWRDTFVLSSALSKFNKKARIKLLEEINLTKPESYAYNRYLNSEKKLYLKQVVNELQHYYKLPLGKAVKVVKKMRKKAYNAKQYKKNQSPFFTELMK